MIQSRPYRVNPEMCCEACVFGTGEHICDLGNPPSARDAGLTEASESVDRSALLASVLYHIHWRYPDGKTGHSERVFDNDYAGALVAEGESKQNGCTYWMEET